MVGSTGAVVTLPQIISSCERAAPSWQRSVLCQLFDLQYLKWSGVGGGGGGGGGVGGGGGGGGWKEVVGVTISLYEPC